MYFMELKDQVSKEYNGTIAQLVIVAMTILLSTKIKDKDLKVKDRFSNRINKKTYDVLWEYEKKDVELAIKIRDVWSTFSMCKSMAGLGGCEFKTLKRLTNEST